MRSSSDQQDFNSTLRRVTWAAARVVVVNVICSPNTEARGRTQVGLVVPTAEFPSCGGVSEGPRRAVVVIAVNMYNCLGFNTFNCGPCNSNTDGSWVTEE